MACQAILGIYFQEAMPDQQALQGQGLRPTVTPDHMPPETPSSKARARILLEMQHRKLSQTDVAGILQWTQPRVSKLLHGRVELGVEELSALCFAVGISLTEAVRDHGFEFCAEMTPSELRFLERIRQLPKDDVDALMRLLAVNAKTRPQQRGSAPVVQKRKRM